MVELDSHSRRPSTRYSISVSIQECAPLIVNRILSPQFWSTLSHHLLQPTPPMQDKLVPNEGAVSSLIIAIKSISVDQIKRMIQTYTPELLNRLEQQSRQPSLYFAALIIDHDMSHQVMRMLIEAGANPHFKDQCLQTVLFYVCREGKQACFELLLDHGLDMNDADIYGQTPLYYIARENCLNLMQIATDRGIVLDYNHTDKVASQTALFYAARQGNLEMCKILIEKGTNVLQQDSNHKAAAFFAKKLEKNEVYEYLNSEVQKLKAKVDDKKLKKKAPQAKSQYKLVKSDNFGNVTELTDVDYQEFIKDNPDLKAMLQNPDNIDHDKIEQSKNTQTWEKSALRIVNTFWKFKNASIFHEPVDPSKLGIEDYFDIVKDPMDFGTIKRKLMYNVYSHPRDFIQDMDLVFGNCLLYNGSQNIYGKTASEMKALFEEEVAKVELMREEAAGV